VRSGSLGELQLVGASTILPINASFLIEGKDAKASLNSIYSSNSFLGELQMSDLDSLQYQKVVTDYPRYITSFSINGDSYVAIAGNTSLVMKWNGVNFVFFQNFTQTLGVPVYRWKFFIMTGNRYFLIPAINANVQTNTTLFEWSSSSQTFNVSQTISTPIRTKAFEYFETIASERILVGGSATELTSFNFSTIFNYQMSVPAVNVTDVEASTIFGLMMVILTNGSNVMALTYFNRAYSPYQTLSATNPLALEIMTFDVDDVYLAVAEYSDSPTVSRIYKFISSSFSQVQNVSIAGATDWKYIPFDGEKYIALTSYYGTTQIFNFNNFYFPYLGSITTYGSFCVEKIDLVTDLYLFVGNSNSSYTSMVYKLAA